MNIFKFLTNKPTPIDQKPFILASLKDCARWRIEFNGYTRAFYDTNNTMRCMRILDVQNHINYIEVRYCIYDMDDINTDDEYLMRIPFLQYIDYLNGIPEHLPLPR